MSFPERLRRMRARIETLEAEAWREDVHLGLRDYVVIRGVQRWGAALFGVNCLAAHAFGVADPRTMHLGAVLEAFVGLHLAGAFIGLFLWSRNRWKYGPQPPASDAASGET